MARWNARGGGPYILISVSRLDLSEIVWISPRIEAQMKEPSVSRCGDSDDIAGLDLPPNPAAAVVALLTKMSTPLRIDATPMPRSTKLLMVPSGALNIHLRLPAERTMHGCGEGLDEAEGG